MSADAEPRGGNPLPLVSPWIWESPDFANFVIRISFFFDNTTHMLTGITVYRDAQCQFTKVIIGVGPDGTPNTSTTVIDVPAGQTLIGGVLLSLLATLGFGTIDAVLAKQMTAA